MSSVGIPPQMTPLVDAQGRIRVEWYRFFGRLDQRTGGATGIGTGDMDAAAFAPLQPASAEQGFADISQSVAISSDQGGDVFQGGAGDCCAADVMQPDDGTVYYIEV